MRIAAQGPEKAQARLCSGASLPSCVAPKIKRACISVYQVPRPELPEEEKLASQAAAHQDGAWQHPLGEKQDPLCPFPSSREPFAAKRGDRGLRTIEIHL